MRASLPRPRTGSIFGSLQPTGGRVTGPLILFQNPTEPLEAVTRSYVESSLSVLNSTSILTGTFPVGRLPGFSGDAISFNGSDSVQLTSTGINSGNYNKVTVDTKGRVIGAASLSQDDIPSFAWSKITSGKPTTLAGYGITNGVSKTGGMLTGIISVQGTISTGLHAATKDYIDTVANSGTTLVAGDVLTQFSSTPPTGFLRCNGAEVSKTTYADLYSIIGNSVNVFNTQPGCGRPWQQQYDINTEQTNDITGWTSAGTLSTNVSAGQVIVTKNRIYLIGGLNAGTNTATVRTAPINSDGTLGTWTTGSNLPKTISYAQSVVTKNRVYILGGMVNGAWSSEVYTAPINTDGTLGSWVADTSLPAIYGSGHAIITNGRVYLISGISNTINYYALINSDGTLGAWTNAGHNLPGVRFASQIVVTKSKVYILGGNGVDTVYSSNIALDGALGAWATETSLPANIRDSQIFVTKNRVYLIGGEINSVYSSAIYTAPINSDGTLGTWSLSATSLPTDIAYSHLAVVKNKIYMISGLISSNWGTSIYTATISGGLNDYSPYYDGTFTASNPNDFKLPDYTSKETATKYYFIKY